MNSLTHLELALEDAQAAHAKARKETSIAFDAYMAAQEREAHTSKIVADFRRQLHESARISRFVALHNKPVAEEVR